MKRFRRSQKLSTKQEKIKRALLFKRPGKNLNRAIGNNTGVLLAGKNSELPFHSTLCIVILQRVGESN